MPNRGRQDTLAGKFIALHVNLLCWGRAYFEEAFSVNGKGEEERLTMPQFSLMVHIRDLGLRTVSEIAKALSLSKSSTSINLSKLVLKGYLRKEMPPDGEDGRRTYFYLTEKGNTAAEKTEHLVLETIEKCFQSYGEDVKTEICSHLDAINQLLLAGGSKE